MTRAQDWWSSLRGAHSGVLPGWTRLTTRKSPDVVDVGLRPHPRRADRRPNLPARLRDRRALAAPLQAICARAPAAWVVGLLMGLFAAAPIVPGAAGQTRLADRRLPPPMRIAVALTVLGALVALAVTWVPSFTFPACALAAMLVGAGANVGLIDPSAAPAGMPLTHRASASSAGWARRRRWPT